MQPVEENHLIDRVDNLTDQMQLLSKEITTISNKRRGFGAHALFDWGVHNPFDPDNLASLLRFYDRSIRRLVAVYYFIFGLLYFRSGLGVITATSVTAAGATHFMQIVIGILYAVVGVGNLSCILYATERYQKVMIGPTVFVAVLAAIITAFAPAALISTIPSVIFWLGITVIHISFGTTIHARIGLRAFTNQLADASEVQQIIKGTHE